MLIGDRPAVAMPGTDLAEGHYTGPALSSASVPVGQLFSDAAILSLFRPFEDARGILLAVSGGPDSVAMMLIAAKWASLLAAPPPISVATVDHRLRESAPCEAEMAASWAAALSLPHRILVWDGAKPKSRIQESAREARYALLFQHAARIGAHYVMSAHHADDQAETILFRLLRGSGIAGLAGMEREGERHGLVHARPLLGYTKMDLVAFCEAKAHRFIEDPSNHDPRYARSKIRRFGALLASEGFDRAALLRLGNRAARAEAALAARASAIREQLPARREPGRFVADVSALKDEAEEILLRILASELKLVGNGKPLRLERLEALVESFAQALRAGIGYKATLGGAALTLKTNHALVIVKEGARRHGHNTPHCVS
jgi:tRNA(Ile)-lysidine synthase